MKKAVLMKGLVAVMFAVSCLVAGNALAKDQRCLDSCKQEKQICDDKCSKGDNSCLTSCNTKWYSCENDCK